MSSTNFPPAPTLGPSISNSSAVSPTDTPMQSAATVATLVVCLSTAMVVVGLRVYTKIALSKSFRAEDCLSIFGWLGLIVFSGLLRYQQRTSQSGKHYYDLPEHNVQTSIQIINANTMIYAIAFFCAKLSILLQFRNIFVTARGSAADVSVKCLMWFHALFYLALLLVCIFQCIPRSKIWNDSTPGSCINADAAYIMYSVVNVFSDFLILLWPVHFIRRLQVPLRKKIALCLVFGAGILGCLISITRLVVSIQYPVGQDPTWNSMRIALWVIAELAAGIIIGCLPVLPRFFRQFAYNTRSASDSLPIRRQDYRRRSTPLQFSSPLASIHTSQLDPTEQQAPYQEFDEHRELVKESSQVTS